MSKAVTSFTENYGAKPIFAGVYTTASVDNMRAEVELFLQNGIHVYVESLRSRNDANLLDADLKIIETVLERTADISSAKGMPRVGINVLFHPDKSRELADRYGLSFIANDAAIGKYEHKDGCADRKHALPNSNFSRSARIQLFAGMTPGYLINRTPDDQWDANMQELHATADAILVGDSPTQSALAQLTAYRKDARMTKPLIAAQGVNAKNITEFLQCADGAVIGSGFRNQGELSLEKIYEIKRLQLQVTNT